ncbi:DMT family transporter [Alteromonas sp. S005]|uniref:DMT family transporter n=1 Tax=Alteromonas sp. S005 TaxID=3117400 RepID=UPI002FE3D3E0
MLKTLSLVAIAMFAFAANSLLCRMALSNPTIDPVSFTSLRIVSGAVALLLLSFFSRRKQPQRHYTENLWQDVKRNASVFGGLSLFVYAISFSFAYISMSTGTGALLLFGAVQLTMISVGLMGGERFKIRQWFGFALAFTGLIILLLPSASAPSLLSGAVMVIAGISWGIYSLLGKKSASALLSTSGNFIYASLLCILMMGTVLLLNDEYLVLNKAGIYYALASGILASGCGYAIWYSVLPLIKSTSAATVQLSVPVIATMMGWTVLEEQLNLQIIIASLATLGGIYLVIKK